MCLMEVWSRPVLRGTEKSWEGPEEPAENDATEITRGRGKHGKGIQIEMDLETQTPRSLLHKMTIIP